MMRASRVKLLIDLAVPPITILLLFAIGLDLAPADFSRVRRQPAMVVIGLTAPLVLLPPVALAMVALFAPPAAIETGLLLITACPIGGISNTYSYLANASVALSVTLTAFSSLLAVATIPLMDAAFGLALGRPLGLTAPVALILAQLLLMLALPVSVGMWVRHRSPQWAERRRPALKRVGFAALTCLLAIIIASDPVVFVGGLRSTVPLAAAFVVASFAIGWLVGASARASAADRFTLAAEFATRNIAVATAIAVTLVGRVEFALFATTYFLTEIPLMLGAIALFRARNRLLKHAA
jgi:BASS family bile acid:Na+ symporter